MDTIRLMLVDDHDVVRTGLKAYLNNQQDMLVVCEAGRRDICHSDSPGVETRCDCDGYQYARYGWDGSDQAIESRLSGK